MKKWFALLAVVYLLFSAGCSLGSRGSIRHTPVVSTAAPPNWTHTPIILPTSTTALTPTSTPSRTPSLTPTPTKTPTALPTPLGGGPGQIACDNCSGRGISLVKPDGTGVIHLSDKHSSGISFAWSADGGTLAFFYGEAIGGQEVKHLTCVIYANTFEEKCFEVGGGRFALSPDGSGLAFDMFGQSMGLYLMDVGSGARSLLVEGEIGSYDWSPDGSKIVFTKGGYIHTINTDGTGEEQLVFNAESPIWSPDGTEIAYISGNYDNRSIIIRRADGTLNALTPEMPLANRLVWTRDGKYMVFLGKHIGYDIYIVEVASKKISQLTESHDILSFTISPDSSLIAVSAGFSISGPGDCTRNCLMSFDGTILREWKNIPCSSLIGPWRP